MSGADPLVYALVVNWNGREVLSPCLSSIASQSYNRIAAIVIDNGSTDGSQELVRTGFKDVRLVETGSNLGYAGGCNVGLKMALEEGADYALLLNNDIELEGEMVASLVHAAVNHPGAAFLGPLIYFHDRPDVIWSAGGAVSCWTGHIRHHGIRERDTGQYSSHREVDYVTGCALLASCSAVRQVGLMDENYYMYNEDTDWCSRARRLGYSVLFVPEARMWHKVSASTGGGLTALKVYYRLKSSFRYFRLHARAYHWLGIAPATAARMVVFVVTQLVRGRPELIGAMVRGLAHLRCGEERRG